MSTGANNKQVRFSDFADRLDWALNNAGVESPRRAQRVAEAGGVSRDTARRYLKGTSRPRTLSGMARLADGLHLFVGWLACGGNVPRTHDELEFLSDAMRMSQEDQDKMLRMMSRLKSGEARHLVRDFDAGRLTARELLDRAGGVAL